MHLGNWQIDDLLTFPCNTHTPSTGAATDADSVPAYRVYEDETGTAILTGSMAKLDDAGTTGFYSEQITLSAANGFEVGKAYTIYVSAAVSSVTGTISHTFQVKAAPATSAALTTAQTDLTTLTGRLTSARAGYLDNLSAGAVATASALASLVTTVAGIVTTLSTMVADVWAYATRTLTQSAASVAAAVAGSTITARRGDTLTAALTGLGNISTRTALWVTVKADPSGDADTAAKVQITEAVGLVYLNGAAATAGQGSVTVTNATTGALTIVVAAAATAQLAAPSTWTYDVQWKDASGLIHTLTEGTFRVVSDVTRATA